MQCVDFLYSKMGPYPNVLTPLPAGIEIEAGLVEMMCRNRNRQMSSEPHGEFAYSAILS